tara:strand:- start:28 stop:282 length:255 start_codon:yes stop_codon:yes gene_type:complete
MENFIKLHNKMHKFHKRQKALDELSIIQKLDGIIADLNADGLNEIANLVEIEKQKIGNKFNQAELQSQIELEDLIKTNKELLDE